LSSRPTLTARRNGRAKSRLTGYLTELCEAGDLFAAMKNLTATGAAVRAGGLRTQPGGFGMAGRPGGYTWKH
jgi:hypothetical protein